MIELVKPWNDSENLSVTYDGSRDGSIVFSSATNEGLDREMGIRISDVSHGIAVDRLVRQEGMREVFSASDGGFILSDGGTFNVLKHGL